MTDIGGTQSPGLRRQETSSEFNSTTDDISDEQLRLMPAPPRVYGLQWQLSNPQERRNLLTRQADTNSAENEDSTTKASPAQTITGWQPLGTPTDNSEPVISNDEIDSGSKPNKAAATDNADSLLSSTDLLGQLAKPQAGVLAVSFQTDGGRKFLIAVLPPAAELTELAKNGFSDENALSELLENSTVFLSTTGENGKNHITTGNLGSGTVDAGNNIKVVANPRFLPEGTILFSNKRAGGADMNTTPSAMGSINEGIIVPVPVVGKPGSRQKVSNAMGGVVTKVAAADLTSLVDNVPVLGRTPVGYGIKKMLGKFASKPAAENLFGNKIKNALANATYYVGAAYQQNIKFNPAAGEVTISAGNQAAKFSVSDAYVELKSAARSMLPDVKQ